MIPFSRPAEWRSFRGDCQELTHRWSKSCFKPNVELTFIVTYEGLKLYLPFYLLTALVRDGCSPLALVRVLPHVMRSSLFLGANMGGALFFICLLRRLIGRFYLYSTAFIPAVMGCACAVLVERKNRRPLLAGYVATVALEMLYSVLKSKNLMSPLPYGEVILFSMATAVLFHRHRSNPGVRDVVSSIIRALMTPRLPAALMKLFQSSHLDNKLMHIILVGVWAFLLGYLLETFLLLFNQGTRLFREKGKLKSILTDPKNIKFAAFLSSLAAGFKLVNSILYYLPLPRAVRLLLAGLAAGLSMLFYRSSSLALYVAWKALEVVYSHGVSRGWLRYIPHGEVLIYALSTGWLFHGWFFEAHNMRWAYWHFLRRITWGRISRINYAELDKFGTGASTRHREWAQREAERRRQHTSDSS